MGLFQLLLVFAAFLCSLVAGFLFAFAVVVMPGIGKLHDKEFLRSFQQIDAVIQNNHPLFLAVWLGSAITLVLAAILGFGKLGNPDRWLLVAVTLVYILGVQLPTISINIPLNNKVQTIDFATADESTYREARVGFESRWNRWNVIRTYVSCGVLCLLLFLLYRQ